jgi:hypothetical protein
VSLPVAGQPAPEPATWPCLLRSALNRQDGLTFLESTAEIVIERVSNTSGRYLFN